jgi:hypothetical protein
MFDVFEIIDGEDANKFTLKGNELTWRPLNVFPVLASKALLAVLLSLRTALL